jgi:hypothetical protein
MNPAAPRRHQRVGERLSTNDDLAGSRPDHAYSPALKRCRPTRLTCEPAPARIRGSPARSAEVSRL